MRILLAEDDAIIGATMQSAMRDAGYAVDWTRDGDTALSTVCTQKYDVVLLDLGLPGKDGMEVLRTLRSRGLAVPVLIVTARDALEHRLDGLDRGADDYVIKPFSVAELLARVRTVARRHSGRAVSVLTNGIVSLDMAYKVATIAGTEVRLSSREYALLHALMLKPGAILSRSDLEGKIYRWGSEVQSNAIDFLIHALRRKLGSEVIKNVRGVGWMVAKPD